MSNAIEVSGISKCYTINHKNKASYSTIKDDFGNMLRRPLGAKKSSTEEQFWALDDVSFEVPQGEVFGIVGKNGSGKSTLLKILSRIVEPSRGRVHIRGRVASLLEVGTGFHPELTGRENVFFNGSMLGMSRQEIARKFNEIIEFSEVEKFIDTPVKFYSSGMYVRLAFSVAAHLDPEILILDEVLAVGDAAFQKKSLEKILATMREGRTVIFVSHGMGSVRQLCSRGILLDKGRVAFNGPVDELVEKYLLSADEDMIQHQTEDIGYTWTNDNNQVVNDYFVPSKIYLTDETGKEISAPITNNKDHWVNIEGVIKKVDPLLNVGYSVWDEEGRTLLYLTLSTDGPKESWPKLKTGKVTFKGKLPKHFLNAGLHRIKAIASLHSRFWLIDPDSSKARIQIITRGGFSDSPYWKDQRGGVMAPIIEWELKS